MNRAYLGHRAAADYGSRRHVRNCALGRDDDRFYFAFSDHTHVRQSWVLIAWKGGSVIRTDGLRLDSKGLSNYLCGGIFGKAVQRKVYRWPLAARAKSRGASAANRST